MKQFLRTRLATTFPAQRSPRERIVRALLFFVPRANPQYNSRLHLVREWWIEFDDQGSPWREIGFAGNGTPVVSGPDRRNFGFWCDTNMGLADFPDGEEISAEQFEEEWNRAAPLRHGDPPP